MNKKREVRREIGKGNWSSVLVRSSLINGTQARLFSLYLAYDSLVGVTTLEVRLFLHF